jgi:hypothetical protein
MRPTRLEELSEPLLRAGVAPRVVQRYLRELEDHYDDALREELAGGADPAAAAQAAWARLGDTEQLLRSALARPELRSVRARFPGVVFGAGAVVGWLAALVLALGATALTHALLLDSGLTPGWHRAWTDGLCFICARVVPVALIAAMFVDAARQRLASRWPLAGTALLALLTGTTRIELEFGAALGEPSQLVATSSLLPVLAPFTDVLGPIDLTELLSGLLRAGLMLALGAAASALLLRRTRAGRRVGTA